jgi:hypothetical protein
MFEHSLATHLQLNPLIDQVNQMQDQMKALDQTNISQLSSTKLEEWRHKAHQLVDMYYAEKMKDLHVCIAEKIKELDQELHEIQTRIRTSMREQDTTHELIFLLTGQIQTLQKNINKIMQNDFPIYTNPLTIDKNLITLQKAFNVLNLSPVYKVMERNEGSFKSLATDNQLLLVHHVDILVLINQSLSIYKQIPWMYGPIYDMCYSSALKEFIIINENEVFLLNKENASITKVRSIPYQQWFSCTCSETSLYLSTKVYSSALVQFDLLHSLAFVKKWASPDLCTMDEAIDGIICNDNKLALMISNDAKKFVRLELRSVASLSRIWSLPLDMIYNEIQAYRFCLMNNDEWLVADHNSSRLLHISKDGKMKSVGPYRPAPCCVIKFGENILVVSTKSVVQFHQL